MVRRQLENGSYEWGCARRGNRSGSRWTRSFSNASIWTNKNGPIGFMTFLRNRQRTDKNRDNSEAKMITFNLEEIESR